MASNFIPVNTPLLDGNERKYLLDCIDSGWISSEGPFVAEFEKKMAALVGRKHAIAVSNGTSAIDAVIEALEIGVGDEVIMPTFTIISCAAQIVRNGGIPVLVDSDPLTWNMDVHQIEEKITPRTKAIMAVHIYGLPVDMDPILSLAKKYGLKVIEDAAEAHGQTYKNKPCGSFGDISTFSFYPNKHVTTGEGGMVLTDDDVLAETIRSLRNLCFNPEKRFVHERLGWNLRMTNLQAALGLAQLERLPDFIKRKKEMGGRYTQNFHELSNKIQLPQVSTDYAQNVYWVYGIILNKNLHMSGVDAIKKLNQMGIGCRPFFYPMHLQPVFKKMGLFNGEHYPVSENLYQNGFYIPSGLALENEEIERVSQSVMDILE